MLLIPLTKATVTRLTAESRTMNSSVPALTGHTEHDSQGCGRDTLTEAYAYRSPQDIPGSRLQ
jgi:hypothetical protein